MIAALLLAASLITPPHGMGRVADLPAAKAGVLQKAGVSIVERYRGIAATKWDGHWYKVPYYIAVTKVDDAMDPAYAAMAELSSRVNLTAWEMKSMYTTRCTRTACVQLPYKPPLPEIQAFRAITLCRGAKGWMSKFSTGSLHDTTVHVFASANGSLYMASTQYDATNHDIFHAERAVETLCPPGAGKPQPLASPREVRAPAGWTALATATIPQTGDEMDTSALWARLSPHTYTMNELLLAQGADVDENVTPEQETDFLQQSLAHGYIKVRTLSSRRQSYCGSKDGWYRVFTGISRFDGYPYRITAETAYDGGTSYELALRDRADERDDPAAIASMRSFCPQKH